jgi:WD40 repeat protein
MIVMIFSFKIHVSSHVHVDISFISSFCVENRTDAQFPLSNAFRVTLPFEHTSSIIATTTLYIKRKGFSYPFPLFVTGSDDQTIRFWNISSGIPSSSAFYIGPLDEPVTALTSYNNEERNNLIFCTGLEGERECHPKCFLWNYHLKKLVVLSSQLSLYHETIITTISITELISCLSSSSSSSSHSPFVSPQFLSPIIFLGSLDRMITVWNMNHLSLIYKFSPSDSLDSLLYIVAYDRGYGRELNEDELETTEEEEASNDEGKENNDANAFDVSDDSVNASSGEEKRIEIITVTSDKQIFFWKCESTLPFCKLITSHTKNITSAYFHVLHERKSDNGTHSFSRLTAVATSERDDLDNNNDEEDQYERCPILVTAGLDKTIILWDIETKTKIKSFEGHSDEITSILIIDSKDDSSLILPLLITGSIDRKVIIWNLLTCEKHRIFSFHEEITSLSTILTSYGYLLAVSGSYSMISLLNFCKTERIRKVKMNHSITTLTVYNPLASSVSASSLLTSSSNSPHPSTHPVAGLTKSNISSSSKTVINPCVLIGSVDHSITLVDLKDSSSSSPLLTTIPITGEKKRKIFSQHRGKINSVLIYHFVSQDSSIPSRPIVISADGKASIKIWDLTTFELIRNFPRFHSGSIFTLDLYNPMKCGKALYTSSFQENNGSSTTANSSVNEFIEGNRRRSSGGRGTKLQTSNSMKKQLNMMKPMILSAGSDGNVMIWDLLAAINRTKTKNGSSSHDNEDNEENNDEDEEDEEENEEEEDDDEREEEKKRTSSQTKETAQILLSRKMEETDYFLDFIEKAHYHFIRSLIVHNPVNVNDDPLFITGSFDRTVIIWNLFTREKLITLKGIHTDYIYSMTLYDPFDHFGEKVNILGKSITTIPNEIIKDRIRNGIHSDFLRFPTLVTGSYDSTIAIWELRKGTLKYHLKGQHYDSITAVTLYFPSSSGPFNNEETGAIGKANPFIISGGLDKIICIWDLFTGQLIHRLIGHSERINCFATFLPSFSMDSSQLQQQPSSSKEKSSLPTRKSMISSTSSAPIPATSTVTKSSNRYSFSKANDIMDSHKMEVKDDQVIDNTSSSAVVPFDLITTDSKLAFATDTNNPIENSFPGSPISSSYADSSSSPFAIPLLLSGSDDQTTIIWEDCLYYKPIMPLKDEVNRCYEYDRNKKDWPLITSYVKKYSFRFFYENSHLFYLSIKYNRYDFLLKFRKYLIAYLPYLSRGRYGRNSSKQKMGKDLTSVEKRRKGSMNQRLAYSYFSSFSMNLLYYTLLKSDLIAFRIILLCWIEALNTDITDLLIQKLYHPMYFFHDNDLLLIAKKYPVEFKHFILSLRLIRNHSSLLRDSPRASLSIISVKRPSQQQQQQQQQPPPQTNHRSPDRKNVYAASIEDENQSNLEDGQNGQLPTLKEEERNENRSSKIFVINFSHVNNEEGGDDLNRNHEIRLMKLHPNYRYEVTGSFQRCPSFRDIWNTSSSGKSIIVGRGSAHSAWGNNMNRGSIFRRTGRNSNLFSSSFRKSRNSTFFKFQVSQAISSPNNTILPSSSLQTVNSPSSLLDSPIVTSPSPFSPLSSPIKRMRRNSSISNFLNRKKSGKGGDLTGGDPSSSSVASYQSLLTSTLSNYYYDSYTSWNRFWYNFFLDSSDPQPITSLIIPLRNTSKLKESLELFVKVSNQLDDVDIFNSEISIISFRYFWDSHAKFYHIKAFLRFFLLLLSYSSIMVTFQFFHLKKFHGSSIGGHSSESGGSEETAHHRYRRRLSIPHYPTSFPTFSPFSSHHSEDESITSHHSSEESSSESLSSTDLGLLIGNIAVLLFFLYYLYEEYRQIHYNHIRTIKGIIFHFMFDFWNFLDFLLLSCGIIGLSLRIGFSDDILIGKSLLALTSVVIWFKLLYFLRPFSNSGPLVTMIVQIAYTIRFFLLVLLCVMIGFALGFWILANTNEELAFGTLTASLLTTFLYSIKQEIHRDFTGSVSSSMMTFLMVMFLMMMTILMMNLLIALMADTFAKVHSKGLAIWRKEQASIIVEESFLFSKVLQKKIPPFLHILKYTTDVGGDSSNENREGVGKDHGGNVTGEKESETGKNGGETTGSKVLLALIQQSRINMIPFTDLIEDISKLILDDEDFGENSTTSKSNHSVSEHYDDFYEYYRQNLQEDDIGFAASDLAIAPISSPSHHHSHRFSHRASHRGSHYTHHPSLSQQRGRSYTDVIAEDEELSDTDDSEEGTSYHKVNTIDGGSDNVSLVNSVKQRTGVFAEEEEEEDDEEEDNGDENDYDDGGSLVGGGGSNKDLDDVSLVSMRPRNRNTLTTDI